ncbi:uncharacterized protein LOC129290611 [Prosopis cineraria]|uniref:uncharacterized protein LOC129290611 n=1 Tax=Prosopis cineraria TaxID=364024 RepID=UPI00240FEBD1|nr:uncharacterized protein LOC129290611 [Prosopis cineraria]
MPTGRPEAALVEYDGAGGDDAAFAKRGCCFRMPCLGYNSSLSPSAPGSMWWERMRSPESKDHWWSRGWKKLQEWSEIVAGPKWKTFIRRFNRVRPGGYTKQGSFRYDASSYALNFDEGQDGEEDYYVNNFSTRYASIPASAKSSMDLGKDGPTFT